jgi:hypothetical protein
MLSRDQQGRWINKTPIIEQIIVPPTITAIIEGICDIVQERGANVHAILLDILYVSIAVMASTVRHGGNNHNDPARHGLYMNRSTTIKAVQQ